MIDWKPFVYFITRVADRKDKLAKVDELLYTRLDRIEERLSKIGNQAELSKVSSNEDRLAKMEEKIDLLLALIKKNS